MRASITVVARGAGVPSHTFLFPASLRASVFAECVHAAATGSLDAPRAGANFTIRVKQQPGRALSFAALTDGVHPLFLLSDLGLPAACHVFCTPAGAGPGAGEA